MPDLIPGLLTCVCGEEFGVRDNIDVAIAVGGSRSSRSPHLFIRVMIICRVASLSAQSISLWNCSLNRWIKTLYKEVVERVLLTSILYILRM